ncbi:lipopolysaccharide transport periplasmic protein LptA [Rheinheimera baltica]|uniref:Lipopolysaccharide transport periplasmic protein LptA n=1 Tax=Rheinheimera baltica TaxID=67576 RepID=A0ABT9HZS7_9GAMM|nr:lipopolysaccharide transport periplasmic protein LptA [Rheinheimera baltica]MDP5136647.1 lipopolysaccharide transport periplasmic protein LptA [Rheinheimera baltica]MDP5142481.1 lipopolysaccharide transport periplasmic protein LptA [Rheinheimera baltica]MDP5150354.1 lipopolysaccharide transport periplasmic protein LptA [Rheinheimera baltica]MDP5188669.1 lipopolysaccharide transport periplasmic protein LptA [Rheinheimera baltica]
MKTNLIVVLFLTSMSVFAAEPDYAQKIQIDADNLVSIAENVATYRSNVLITQGSMQMKADQLEINASAGKGKEVYVATGTPVRYSQLLADGKPVTASAAEMRYEPSSRTLTLTGDAELTQSGSVVKASVIRYNVEKQQLSAESNETKRVTTIFTPEEKTNP